MELDDTDNASSSHPGNVVIPAVLSVAESTGASGADVAVAIVAGYDAMLRIGRASGPHAAGSLEYMSDGSWANRLQVGAAAEHGVLAALLARRGFTGPSTILEGRLGFLHAYTGSTATDVLVDGLDEPFAINDVSIKAFACCRYNQTPVDGLLQLRTRYGFGPEDVE